MMRVVFMRAAPPRAVLVFAAAILASGFAAVPARAQSPRPPAVATFAAATSVSGAPIGPWLRAEIARRWAVAPARVELDWGDTPARIQDRPSADAELVGGAADQWVLTLPADADDGPRRVLIRAGVLRATPVATRELDRTAELGPDDVSWTDQVEWGPPQPPAPDPIGQRAQRRIRTGEALLAPAVGPGPWVESRAPVEVVFQKGRVTIALRGTALADALPGERVHVRLEDGRRVQGRATGPGLVALDVGGDR